METISKWSKLKGEETRSASLMASSKSLFYRLRLEDQLVVAAKSDSRMRNELKRSRANLKASKEEKKKLFDSNKKLKNDIQSNAKKIDALSRMVNELDKEKTRLQLDHDAKVNELVTRVDSL